MQLLTAKSMRKEKDEFMALSFPALRSRNYRLFFGGQELSLTGTWMTQTATVWLVYQLANSADWRLHLYCCCDRLLAPSACPAPQGHSNL